MLLLFITKQTLISSSAYTHNYIYSDNHNLNLKQSESGLHLPLVMVLPSQFLTEIL